MPTKEFEQMIQFLEVPQGPNQPSIWLPLVNIVLITPTNNRVSLPLLFDTGASVTTLRSDLYPVLGLQSWNQGQSVQTSTAGGYTTAYRYDQFTIEAFGKTVNCPIHLCSTLPSHPCFVGLFGRETLFNEFGFGFWESSHEIYVSSNP